MVRCSASLPEGKNSLSVITPPVHSTLQEDPELEAIRQRRMAELMAARGGGQVGKHSGSGSSRVVNFRFASPFCFTAATVITAGCAWCGLTRGCRAARGGTQVTRVQCEVRYCSCSWGMARKEARNAPHMPHTPPCSNIIHG